MWYRFGEASLLWRIVAVNVKIRRPSTRFGRGGGDATTWYQDGFCSVDDQEFSFRYPSSSQPRETCEKNPHISISQTRYAQVHMPIIISQDVSAWDDIQQFKYTHNNGYSITTLYNDVSLAWLVFLVCYCGQCSDNTVGEWRCRPINIDITAVCVQLTVARR